MLHHSWLYSKNCLIQWYDGIPIILQIYKISSFLFGGYHGRLLSNIQLFKVNLRVFIENMHCQPNFEKYSWYLQAENKNESIFFESVYINLNVISCKNDCILGAIVLLMLVILVSFISERTRFFIEISFLRYHCSSHFIISFTTHILW